MGYLCWYHGQKGAYVEGARKHRPTHPFGGEVYIFPDNFNIEMGPNLSCHFENSTFKDNPPFNNPTYAPGQ